MLTNIGGFRCSRLVAIFPVFQSLLRLMLCSFSPTLPRDSESLEGDFSRFVCSGLNEVQMETCSYGQES
ncbi:MAG: hypothetical protein DME23_08630 [Verrucomicrobia bacterium]|nr:MAG: hypothetical protein DME23_08630 [Verrucomicrobiota bacterium]